MAGEKKSGYHPGGRVIRPTRKKATTRVKHSGQGIGGRGGLPSLKAPSRPRRGTVRTGVKHSGQGRGGRGGIPNVKAPSRPTTATQARPARRSTRGSTPRANPMSRFRQAGRRARSRFNRRR